MHSKLPAVVLVSLLVTSVAAHRADADTSKGSQLAQQWCASCHITGGSPAGNVQQGPPSFHTIAGARTAEQLRAFLSQRPHAPTGANRMRSNNGGRLERYRKFVDSPLEGPGFEPSVPLL
jgi:cytochrome c553